MRLVTCVVVGGLGLLGCTGADEESPVGGGGSSTSGTGGAGGSIAVGGGDTFSHGSSVTVSGAGFGVKDTAAPYRSSFHHPEAAQNFQQSGAFDGSYWSPVGEVMIALHDDGDGMRTSGLDSHQYNVRLEYSAQGNWEAEGYSAGVQSDLPPSRVLYLSWWDYFEPGFDASPMQTGAANFKWIYNSAGQNPHAAIQVINDGAGFLVSAAGGVAGDTSEEQDANLELPLGGGFYARPLSWTPDFAFPVDRWYLVELFYQVNSAPGVQDGWTAMRIDNQLIYRANQIDVYGTDAPDEFFANLRLGGNYGFDESGAVHYRHYGDVYIDDSFAHVMVGDQPAFDDCQHLELQVATAWSATGITFTLNQGSFAVGDTVYAYVIDEQLESHGPWPIVLASP